MSNTNTSSSQSAALTLLQISSTVTSPATRTFVFLTLSSSMISLSLGSAYILRFSNMKAMRKAAGWLEVSQYGALIKPDADLKLPRIAS